jgi:PKD repeat protein
MIKKLCILLIVIAGIAKQANAQCPITVSSTNICPGGTATLTASGATSYLWSPSISLNSAVGTTVMATPDTTTIYTLHATTGTCTATATTTVTVYPAPVANFIGIPDSGCSPLNVAFTDLSTISSGSIVSWYWTFGNGGAFTSEFPPSQNYTNISTTFPAYYTVTLVVTSDNGCVNEKIMDSYIEVLPCATGISQYSSLNTQISIYPNPAKDVLNVECEMVNEKTTLVVTDMLGNSIYHSTFTTQHKTINVADLSEGVYNISIGSSEGVINKRLVIVK